MKKLFILVALAASVLSCTGNKSGGDATVQSSDYYTCPMHPSVHSDRPGACPVCGMALVKKSMIVGDSADATMPGTVHMSQSQRVMANVATSVAQRRTLERSIDAVGVVDVAEPLQTIVSARFRGRIEKLYVNYTGEVVRKGELLFELYSPDLLSAEQELLVALEARDNAPSEMSEQMLASSRERLQIHFGLTREQIRTIEKNRKILSSTKFYAPIAGTVLRKEVQEGQYVEEGMMLYQLADLSRVWIYADIYERDASLLRTGQMLEVTSETFPGETFTGKILFIEPTVSSESRAVRVRTEVINRSAKLKPSMYVKVHVAVGSDNVLTVPTSSVITTGKRTVVWVEVAGNEFEPRDVVVGSTANGYVAVLSGLNEGDHVVTSGGYLIDSESQLQH